jgi:hypothetical protein
MVIHAIANDQNHISNGRLILGSKDNRGQGKQKYGESAFENYAMQEGLPIDI